MGNSPDSGHLHDTASSWHWASPRQGAWHTHGTGYLPDAGHHYGSGHLDDTGHVHDTVHLHNIGHLFLQYQSSTSHSVDAVLLEVTLIKLGLDLLTDKVDQIYPHRKSNSGNINTAGRNSVVHKAPF